MRRLHFFLSMLLLASEVFSTNMMGVRGLSLGGADRALGSTNNAIFYNPSALIKSRQISVDTDYQYVAKEEIHRISMSMSDSKTQAWALGLAYFTDIKPKGSIFSNHYANLSIAMPIATDMFAFGASFIYRYRPHFADEKNSHFFNINTGLTFSAPMGLSFAVVLEQLLPPKGREDPLSLSLGMAMEFEKILPVLPLSLSADLSLEGLHRDKSLNKVIALGLQYKVLPVIPIRLGYRSLIDEKKYYLSLGSGLTLGVADIDLLYLQDLKVGKNREVGFALRFFL